MAGNIKRVSRLVSGATYFYFGSDRNSQTNKQRVPLGRGERYLRKTLAIAKNHREKAVASRHTRLKFDVVFFKNSVSGAQGASNAVKTGA